MSAIRAVEDRWWYGCSDIYGVILTSSEATTIAALLVLRLASGTRIGDDENEGARGRLGGGSEGGKSRMKRLASRSVQNVR